MNEEYEGNDLSGLDFAVEMMKTPPKDLFIQQLTELSEERDKLRGLLEEALGSVYGHLGYSEFLELDEYLIDLALRIEYALGVLP